jgi:hypothetical protein
MNHIDHIEHVEDLPVLNGFSGAIQACSYMRSALAHIGGTPDQARNRISIKYDGSFSFVAGWRHNDFFVATKSFFNKKPIYFMSEEEINASSHNDDLKLRLNMLLAYLPDVIHEGIYQGDFMYIKQDIQEAEIDGIPCAYFKPNTLAYAFHQSGRAQFNIEGVGVAIHTRYAGTPTNLRLDSTPFRLKDLGTDVRLMPTRLQSGFIVNADALEKASAKLSAIEAAVAKYADVLNELAANIEFPRLVKLWTKARCSGYDEDFQSWVGLFYMTMITMRKTKKGKDNAWNRYGIVEELIDKHWKKIFKHIIKPLADLKAQLIYFLEQGTTLPCYWERKTGGFVKTFNEGFVFTRSDGTCPAKFVLRDVFSFLNNNPDVKKNWETY